MCSLAPWSWRSPSVSPEPLSLSPVCTELCPASAGAGGSTQPAGLCRCGLSSVLSEFPTARGLSRKNGQEALPHRLPLPSARQGKVWEGNG